LPFIPRYHIDRLLDQVKIILLVGRGRTEIEVSINKSLTSSIKKRVDVTLIPARLLDWLKFAIKVVQPLPHIPLIRF